jgi:hypothetical protein
MIVNCKIVELIYCEDIEKTEDFYKACCVYIHGGKDSWW